MRYIPGKMPMGVLITPPRLVVLLTSPVTLPPVSRENISARIKALRRKTPSMCTHHGGIDCSLGPDKDGSVICLDGFLDAVPRFRLRCSEVRLETGRLSIQRETALKDAAREDLPTKTAVTISVRNLSGIEAYGVKVDITLPQLEPVVASGPARIEPYAIAEYSLPLDNNSGNDILENINYRVRCTNCSTVRRNNR